MKKTQEAREFYSLFYHILQLNFGNHSVLLTAIEQSTKYGSLYYFLHRH